MTLKTYLDTRTKSSYGKHLRIIDKTTGRNCGSCTLHFNAPMVGLKYTKNFLFIFINPIDK